MGPLSSLDSTPNQALSPPTVAVVVPVYNGESDLPQLLQGLTQQTYPPQQVEVWLVDNGSCDRTGELLQTAVSSHANWHCLSYGAIQSSYAARNVGIRAACSEIIAFTDADCLPSPQWIAELVKPFSQPQVGIVAGEILAQPAGSWLERYAELKQTLSQRDSLSHSFCPYGQTANLAIRAEIFHQVGLFRPYLTTGGDADICWRILRETDWQMSLAEAAIVRHRHRRSLPALRRQWYRYGCSNRYLHELYGVELMRKLGAGEVRYRLARWMLKEIPAGLRRWGQGQAAPIELLVTPLDLVCFQARTRGQRLAQLPPAARHVPRL